MRGLWMRLWNWEKRVRSPKSGRLADIQKVVSFEWDEGCAVVESYEEKVREHRYHGLL